MNWKQKRCIFSIVSCSMYAVRVCQLFPTRFGSFVHSSLQIFRCFIKHNTKNIFLNCVRIYISHNLSLFEMSHFMLSPIIRIVLSTVIYSTIILRCVRDAVNFAWLLQKFDTVILAIIINLNALSQICEPNMFYLKTL